MMVKTERSRVWVGHSAGVLHGASRHMDRRLYQTTRSREETIQILWGYQAEIKGARERVVTELGGKHSDRLLLTYAR